MDDGEKEVCEVPLGSKDEGPELYVPGTEAKRPETAVVRAAEVPTLTRHQRSPLIEERPQNFLTFLRKLA